MTTLICANCNTKTTPLWRKDTEGRPLCNACGLFKKLHNNQDRPMSLKTDVIKHRNRVKKSASPPHSFSPCNTKLPGLSSLLISPMLSPLDAMTSDDSDAATVNDLKLENQKLSKKVEILERSEELLRRSERILLERINELEGRVRARV